MDQESKELLPSVSPEEKLAFDALEKSKKEYSIYSQFRIPALEALSDSIKDFQDKISKLSQQFVLPDLSGMSFLTETFDHMKRANEIRAEKYPAISSNLAEAASHSWFASVLMDFHSYEELSFVTDGVEADKRQEVIEAAYAEKYRELFPYLLNKVVSMFPARAFAIAPAGAAHERGEYALSVPVFFSQAEGILRDITFSELFSERISPISKYARQQRALIPTGEHWLNLSDDAIWAQLSGDLPIGWGQKLRIDNSYTGLNRNTTLHGIDINYASEINSLKAFSLLCHIAGIAEWQAEEE